MACSLAEIKAAACSSGIAKEQSPVKLLQLIAQLTCEASQAEGSGVPSGVILMWSGIIATIPAGWVLCDGANGTPDLRNRFVVAADADSGGSAKTTIAGAATQSGGSILTSNVLQDFSQATQDSSAWVDTMAGAGPLPPDDALPPYYALAYIMKT